MAEYPWVKVWWAWYTSRSHSSLSFEALHMGPFLMSLAKSSPEPGWLIQADGTPWTTRDLAREGRVKGPRGGSCGRSCDAVMDACMAQLVAVAPRRRRTVDGAFGFAPESWKRYQDGPFAERQRRKRKRDIDVTSAVTCHDRSQKSEVRSSLKGGARARAAAPPADFSDEMKDLAKAVMAAYLRVCVPAGFLRHASEPVAADLAALIARAAEGAPGRDLAWFEALIARAAARCTWATERRTNGLSWILRDEQRIRQILEGELDDHELRGAGPMRIDAARADLLREAEAAEAAERATAAGEPDMPPNAPRCPRSAP